MTDIANDDDLLAAEYVLRILPRREEAAFETRLAREPGLSLHVASWTNRLAGLNAGFANAMPRSAVRKQLMSRLFGTGGQSGIWQRLGLWQAVSFASLALAAVVGWQALTVAPSAPVPSMPVLMSEIAAEDQSLRLVAVYDAGSGDLRVSRTAGQAATGRVLELWAIAEGAAPVSLGVLPADPSGSLSVPPALRAQMASLTLAVSDEPPGGSPTGAPTGAVLAVGTVTSL